MGRALVAYGCGSPVRLPIVESLALGAGANKFIPFANPSYQGGDSIVWGLIRGAPKIMFDTVQNGCDYFQIDNAYFGRNIYYRVTLNALQLSWIPSSVVSDRYKLILNQFGKTILPWKQKRNGPIVICPSSDHLHHFMGGTLESWVSSVIAEIKKYTDRPITVRYKELMPKDDIDAEIHEAWCVVTHVSAAALDALRLGIPVIVTGECAASPLSTPIQEIERPFLSNGREELFSLLACGQFTPEEMIKDNVLEAVRLLSELRP
ncbi:hypothetical protein D521_0129 [beta proteobacterium CB]|nr:hypothetical protein D521_0129 [beta proteobacterium CB]